MRKLFLRLEIFVLRCHADHLMDLCRRTGGELSPYLEKLDETHRQMGLKRWALIHG